MASVAQQLSGVERPVGTDMVILQHWLIWFGAASVGLRKVVMEFGDWMANGRPPWTAYRELILGRLIVLDKCPGVHPVRVVETWRRMLREVCVDGDGGGGQGVLRD